MRQITVSNFRPTGEREGREQGRRQTLCWLFFWAVDVGAQTNGKPPCWCSHDDLTPSNEDHLSASSCYVPRTRE